MYCQACQEGRHWDCGMQTWCECECAGPDGDYSDDYPENDHGGLEWYGDETYPEEDDYYEEEEDEEEHGLECTCETCLQNYPEREIYLEGPDEADRADRCGQESGGE